MEEGAKRHNAFVQEHADDSARFKKTIPPNTMKTFVDQGAKNMGIAVIATNM